jgi:hypothetical protein
MLRKTYVHNKVAVAVAKKMARIVWVTWTCAQPYQPLAALPRPPGTWSNGIRTHTC